jgi:isoamylase
MEPEDWDSGFGRSIGVFLNGDGIRGKDMRGEAITDVHFLILLNAHTEAVEFTLPEDEYASAWEIVVDTAGAGVSTEPRNAGDTVTAQAVSALILRQSSGPEPEPDNSVAASLIALSGTSTPINAPARPVVE